MPQKMLIEKTTGYTAQTPPPVKWRKEKKISAMEHFKHIRTINYMNEQISTEKSSFQKMTVRDLELTYNEEHEEDKHSHEEPIPETPPVRKAYAVRFS